MIGCGSVGSDAARGSCSAAASTSRSTRSPCRPTSRRTCRWPASRRRRALVDNDRRTPAWDAQFNRAADISYRQLQLLVGRALRRLVDRQLHADQQPGRPAPAAPRHGGGQACCRRASTTASRGARSGRASVSDEVRHPLAGDPHRAVDLPRQPRARLPDVGRPHRDPQVRHAARAVSLARADRRSTAPASARAICSATRSSSRSRASSP